MVLTALLAFSAREGWELHRRLVDNWSKFLRRKP